MYGCLELNLIELLIFKCCEKAYIVMNICYANEKGSKAISVRATDNNTVFTFSLPYMTEISVVIRQWT